MKAIGYEQYGLADQLRLIEVETPEPQAGEVLIKVHATALNKADWFLLTGKPFMVRLEAGLSRPKSLILGSDVAGIVEAVGANVTQFQIGDEVFGDLSGCGLGGLAEYVCAPAAVLAKKPAEVSFEQAAAVPMSGVTALHGVRDHAELQAGEHILIYGASGGVGSFAVQIAKALGAEVTAVCSTSKIEMVRALGADHILDYRKEDIAACQTRFDRILGVNGHQPLAVYKQLLKPHGRYVAAGGASTTVYTQPRAGVH